MNQILLVEGRDDLFVFSNLLDKHQVRESFKIIDKDGINSLFLSIPIYLKADISTIGIIVDADTDINTRWNTLKSILKNHGYNLPESRLYHQGLSYLSAPLIFSYLYPGLCAA
mgnify:CR=1 FL=1